MDSFLLDISLASIKAENVNNSLDKLEDSLKQLTDYIQLSVKIHGENRYVLIVGSEHVETVSRRINSLCLSLTQKSTPLLNYDTFMKTSLGVDDSKLPEKRHPAKLDHNRPIILLHVTIEYVGKSQEEMLGAWRDEAVGAMSLAYSGQAFVRPYKVLASRQAYVFLQMDTGSVDASSFTLPLQKRMGDQVHFVAEVGTIITGA